MDWTPRPISLSLHPDPVQDAAAIGIPYGEWYQLKSPGERGSRIPAPQASLAWPDLTAVGRPHTHGTSPVAPKTSEKHHVELPTTPNVEATPRWRTEVDALNLPVPPLGVHA